MPPQLSAAIQPAARIGGSGGRTVVMTVHYLIMGGNVSSILETQKAKMDTIAYVCCSNQNYELKDSADRKLLLRPAPKKKSSRLTVRKWRQDTDTNYCTDCSAEAGQDNMSLIIPADKRGIRSPRFKKSLHDEMYSPRSCLQGCDAETKDHQTSHDFKEDSQHRGRERPKSPWKMRPAARGGAVSFEVCNDTFERPKPAAQKPSEPPPGWTEWEAKVLKRAVEATARECSIDPPGYADSQVRSTRAIDIISSSPPSLRYTT